MNNEPVIATIYVERAGRKYRLWNVHRSNVVHIERQASENATNGPQEWFGIGEPIYYCEDSIWNLDMIDHMIIVYEWFIKLGSPYAPNR